MKANYKAETLEPSSVKWDVEWITSWITSVSRWEPASVSTALTVGGSPHTLRPDWQRHVPSLAVIVGFPLASH